MSTSDRLKNNIFYWLAGTAYVYALSGAVMQSTYMQLGGMTLLWYCGLFCLAFCLLFYSRRTFSVFSIALAAVMVILWLYLYVNDYDVAWFNRLSAYINELYLHVRGMTRYSPQYDVLGKCIVALFALGTVACIRASASFYFLSLLGFGVFGGLAYFQYAISGGYTMVFLFVFVLLFARRLSAGAARGGGDSPINVSGLQLIPICLVLIMAANLIPRPASAADGRDVLANMQTNLYLLDDYFYSAFSPKYFSFSTTGFSGGDGRLGGNVTPNDRPVMRVYMADGAQRPYIAGAYKDTYTGDRWQASGSEAVPLDIFDKGMFYQGRLDARGWDDLCRYVYGGQDAGGYTGRRDTAVNIMSADSNVLIVVPQRPTRAVFAPGQPLAVAGLGTWSQLPGDGRFKKNIIREVDAPQDAPGVSRDAVGTLTFDRAIQGGWAYATAYYDPAQLDIMPRQMMLEAFAQAPLDEQTLQDLAPYLQLPENLPQRVIDLAEAVTEGKRTPYEKMKALESFLSQYPYTLTPGPVPQGADFVDYFLFEAKTGYCTYYATALAVMGRCVGIPTRYAEGFMLPSGQSSEGGIQVTNAQAHAWCDAFFTISGWYTFEATGPYNYPYYHGGAEPPQTSDELMSQSHDPGRDEEIDDMLEEAEERQNDRQTTTPAATTVSATAPTGEEEASGGRPAALILCVILAVAAAVALRYWMYSKKIQALRALPNNAAAVEYFGRILGFNAAKGLPMRPGETAMAYGQRLDSGYGRGVEGAPLAPIAGIFSHALYSGRDISDTQRQEVEDYYTRLAAPAQATLPQKARAWIERYLLGRY